MEEDQVSIPVLFTSGPLELTITTLTAWGLTVFLWGACLFVCSGLKLAPGPLQIAVEGIVSAMENAVQQLLHQQTAMILPFIMGLWWFLLAANLVGLIPGLHSPTRDISITSALAILVFLSVHWFGVRMQGLKQYLRHYLAPTPLLLPFHIVSEISRTIALAVRLFGNMMSLEMVTMILLVVAGFLVPVPILMLHIVEALVQAYIFGMLALVYIASGIHSQQRRQTRTQQRGQ